MNLGGQGRKHQSWEMAKDEEQKYMTGARHLIVTCGVPCLLNLVTRPKSRHAFRRLPLR